MKLLKWLLGKQEGNTSKESMNLKITFTEAGKPQFVVCCDVVSEKELGKMIGWFLYRLPKQKGEKEFIFDVPAGSILAASQNNKEKE